MKLNSQTHGPGGQILLQIVDEDWRPVPSLRAALLDLVAHIDARADHRLALSIDLAGMLVFAGNEEGLAALRAEAPPTPGRAPSPKMATARSEEHTSELQSLMRISYAVFCLKKKTKATKSQHK